MGADAEGVGFGDGALGSRDIGGAGHGGWVAREAEALESEREVG